MDYLPDSQFPIDLADLVDNDEQDSVEPSAAETQQPDILACLQTKAKSDAMYELRKLQHQHKPVSEFTAKQELEQFFHKRIPPPSLDTASASPGNPSLVGDRAKQLESIATTEQDFMPENVRLEVRGVFDQRRVTETLEGPLREEIDRVLAENLDRRRRPRARRNRSGNQRNHGEQRHNRQGGRPGVRQGSHVRFNIPEDGRFPLPRRNQGQIVDSLLQSPALNSLAPEAREEIVTEVRSLVQQQLVTSALSGEFRGVLELNIQQQLNNTRAGLTHDDVARQVQQGRRLGSLRRPQTDRAEAAEGNGDMQREMRDMRNQMDELKQLMKTCFEVQLDIQRSIRQEVAAALTLGLGEARVLPTLASPSVVQTVSPPVPIPVVDGGNCVICSDNAIDSVMYRCGHMCTCVSCGIDLRAKGMKCPVCRAPITDVIRAYSSML